MKINKIPKSGFYYEVACVLGEILNQHWDALPVEIILQYYINDSPTTLFIKSHNFIDHFIKNKYYSFEKAPYRHPFYMTRSIHNKLKDHSKINHLFDKGTDLSRCFDDKKYIEITKNRFWTWINEWAREEKTKFGDWITIKRELVKLIDAGIIKKEQFIKLLNWKFIYYPVKRGDDEFYKDREERLIFALGAEKIKKTTWYRFYTNKTSKEISDSFTEGDFKFNVGWVLKNKDLLSLNLSNKGIWIKKWEKGTLIEYLNNNGITKGVKSLTKDKLIKKIMTID